MGSGYRVVGYVPIEQVAWSTASAATGVVALIACAGKNRDNVLMANNL